MHFFFNETHECDECGKEFEYSHDEWNEGWEEDCEGNTILHFQQIQCPHCGDCKLHSPLW